MDDYKAHQLGTQQCRRPEQNASEPSGQPAAGQRRWRRQTGTPSPPPGPEHRCILGVSQCTRGHICEHLHIRQNRKNMMTFSLCRKSSNRSSNPPLLLRKQHEFPPWGSILFYSQKTIINSRKILKVDLRPPRSTTLWKLERLNAVAMSWPSRTQEEFIRPMNFSISSSDLQHRRGREGFCRRRAFCRVEAHAAAESVATCRWLGRSPLPGYQRSFHSGSSPPWVEQQQSQHHGHWKASRSTDNAKECHEILCGLWG